MLWVYVLLIAAFVLVIAVLVISEIKSTNKMDAWRKEHVEKDRKNSEAWETAIARLKNALSGDHQLHRFFPETITGWRASGSSSSSFGGLFFLILGAAGGESKAEFTAETFRELRVKFAWLAADGAYVLTDVPLDKIRPNIDDRAEAPTARFDLTNLGGFELDVFNGPGGYQAVFDRVLRYVTITLKPADWPSELQTEEMFSPELEKVSQII